MYIAIILDELDSTIIYDPRSKGVCSGDIFSKVIENYLD